MHTNDSHRAPSRPLLVSDANEFRCVFFQDFSSKPLLIHIVF